MRIWILSDLHRSAGKPWTPPVIPNADVAVVAGDVGEGLVESIDWLAEKIRPHMRVVCVAGNHEFYRRVHGGELALGRAAACERDIHFLEDAAVVIDEVAFVGCTLWTDYRLDGDAMQLPAMEAARRRMNDHRLIAWKHKPRWARFRPEEALWLHRNSRRYLEAALATPNAVTDPPPRATVVVTHHAPSAESIDPAFRTGGLNPSFASRLDTLIQETGPDIWVHGHTHSSFDYPLHGTRVLCNPKGYGDENRAFDPAFVVEVPC